MLVHIRPALLILLWLTVITGVAYPLAVTGIAQVAFPAQANGSLIRHGDKVVGSRLIGQSFLDAKYFRVRPSSTATVAYNAAASSGSNLGPTNPSLKDSVDKAAAQLSALDTTNTAPIPVDLVTASGSGLDPHISPAAAIWQVSRVGRARGLPEETVKRLVQVHTQDRDLGVLGEPVVNVLELNLALDALASPTAQ
jgi:K+-transporting ATPase ATPase C chain